MNNLVIAGLIGIAGAAVFFHGRQEIDSRRRASAAIENRIRDARIDAKNSRAEARRLESIFTIEQEAIERLRSQANATQKTADTLGETQLGPEKEGFWPADKPYFYLSKSRLDGLSYWPLTSGDELSDTAVALFGMSPVEIQAANSAHRAMREQIRELDSASLIATNTPAMLEGWPGTKTSVYIGEFPKETIDTVDQQFKDGLLRAVGPERGALLARRIDETFDNGAYGMGKSRTITLIREPNQIQVALIDPEGNMMSSRETSEEGRQQIPREFRHLFPKE